MQWQEITVDRISTRYLMAGRGTPVIFLHGIGDSAADWQDIMPILARNYRVYALDLPGQGDSTKQLAQYTPDFLAHFVQRFLDALEITGVFLVGHSLGGLVALHMALANPYRVRALTLMASGGLGREINPLLSLLTTPLYGELAVAWGQSLPGRIQRPWQRLPLLFAKPGNVPGWWIHEQERLAGQPGFLEATLAILRTVADWGGQREVLLDKLPGLSMPTLVAWGEWDQVLPVSQAHAACAKLPRGQMHLIAGGGHLLPVEHPEQCARMLEGFFAQAV